MIKDVRSRLLAGYHGTTVPYPQDHTILQLFEHRAAAAPDAPAVTFAARTLSYGQLDDRADALAARLRRHGVGRGDLVPLLMRNGLELPVAMLAAMKVAAPFVPLDDLWPADRLRAVVTSIKPKAVLVASTGAALSDSTPILPVAVDDLAGAGAGDFGAPAGMDDVIYGFYTSGSTGIPKCSLNIHRGLLNRFRYMSRRFGERTDDVVLQNSRHVFDSSLWQLLWPLTNGSQVIIPVQHGLLDLAATTVMIRRYGVTMTDFVPSIFNVLVELITAQPALVGHLASMRHILIGGEEINTAAVQTFRSLVPQVVITNTYGPTEASIGSVFHEVTDDDVESIPIGRPIDNTWAVVLDEQGHLLPPGKIGEIHIGGDCIGLGYLHDPERTQSAFVDNPFATIPGSRLYRTGDLGYHRPDGQLQFVGRRDQQVKIGGVRVELSEIEAALLTHPDIREAKAIVQELDGTKRLMAFVTTRGAPTVNDVRVHALAALPRYLVPTRFVILDRMPLTPNGKVDRKELAAMASRRWTARDDVLLDGPEGVVQDIWLKLLPVDAVGAGENFFDCGGDSLSAHRLSLALADRFGVGVSIQDIVRAPTVREQAALVTGDHAVEQPAVVPLVLADAVLPADITVRWPVVRSGPEHVLLTGATGFVGGQLLHDLLAGTEATVHCLVRADDPASARQRVVANLHEYRLWTDDRAGRIIAVPGDLGLPRLGLGDEVYRRLAEVVDVVVHNGALVNLVLGYDSHRAANVTGTVEILRLATARRTVPVHFVSTLGVFPPAVTPGERFLERPLPESTLPPDGYSQSKGVGERLMAQAAARGVPVAVHRLGEVMANSTTGVPSRRGLPDLLVRACLTVGACFTSPITMDYTPVDHVGALVTAAVVQGEEGHFHLTRAQPVALDALLASFRDAFDLPQLSYREFWHALRDAGEAAPTNNELAIVLAVVPPADTMADPELDERLAALFRHDMALFSTARADRLVAERGIPRPVIGRDVFGRYAAYYRDSRLSAARERRGRRWRSGGG